MKSWLKPWSFHMRVSRLIVLACFVASLTSLLNWMSQTSSSSVIPVISVVSAPGQRDDAIAARRSPVVEVFERSRDAVVNISSKEIVTVRDPFGMDRFLEDFF